MAAYAGGHTKQAHSRTRVRIRTPRTHPHSAHACTRIRLAHPVRASPQSLEKGERESPCCAPGYFPLNYGDPLFTRINLPVYGLFVQSKTPKILILTSPLHPPPIRKLRVKTEEVTLY